LVELFLTTALDGAEWSASHVGCFTLGKRASSPYSLDRRQVWTLWSTEIYLAPACYRSYSKKVSKAIAVTGRGGL
jgi:hypothetical protein